MSNVRDALVLIPTTFNNILYTKFVTDPVGSYITPFIIGIKYLG